MRRTILLKYPARCHECGTELQIGDKARYYGPSRVYGTTCHARTDPALRSHRPKRNTHGLRVAQANRQAAKRDGAIEEHRTSLIDNPTAYRENLEG